MMIVCLVLILAVKNRGLAMLLLNQLCSSINKTTCPLDSFHPETKNLSESITLPACCKIINIMFSETYEEEVLKIPMLDNTISRRIPELTQVKSQVISSIKETTCFAIQLDESTDFTGKAQVYKDDTISHSLL